MTCIIPQSFIDQVILETDRVLETLKRQDAQCDSESIEKLALYMFDKRGMIDDTEHRQALSVMVALLLLRISNA